MEMETITLLVSGHILDRLKSLNLYLTEQNFLKGNMTIYCINIHLTVNNQQHVHVNVHDCY